MSKSLEEKIKNEWGKEWREFLIRSLFSGEEVGIRKIFHLPPKKQCWVAWEHLEKVVEKLLTKAYGKGREGVHEKIKPNGVICRHCGNIVPIKEDYDSWIERIK